MLAILGQEVATVQTGSRIGVVAGYRTPFTKAGGALSRLTPLELSATIVREVADRTEVTPDRIGSLVMGSAIQYPSVPYLARETAIALGWHRVNAYSAESACATSARTAINAAYELATGEAEIAIAGGVESMSHVPVEAKPAVRDALVKASKAAPHEVLQIMMSLSLGDLFPDPPAVTEPYSGKTLGEHCEEMVADWDISREAADAFAVASHHKAARAIEEGLLPAHTVAVITPDGTVKEDSIVRPDTSMEAVAKLSPVFDPNGTVTAANASPLTDGAAALLLATEDACERHDLTPKVWIRSWAFTSHDPAKGVLLGPTYALPLALERAGITPDDVDLWELHEAFAGQVLANLAAMESAEFARAELGRDAPMGRIPEDRLNVNGGSVSIGHPFGATGARIIMQLADEMQRRDVAHGALAICAGGTRGAAIVLQRDV